jgi:DNA-binding SARP family transcriptional activator
MRLHYLAGDRSEALRQFKRCAAALRSELDVAPSARTIGLYREILADRLDTPDAIGGAGAGALALLAGVAAQVAALRALVLDMEAQLRDEIERIERLGPRRP